MTQNKNIFLDINVIVDFIEPQRIGHNKAVELIQYLTLNDYLIHISEDMLTTIYYISKDKKLTLSFLRTIMDDWRVLSFGSHIIKKGIELSLDEGVDLEDMLQCLCAQNNGCALLITNDNKFYNCGLPIYKVDAFLQLP